MTKNLLVVISAASLFTVFTLVLPRAAFADDGLSSGDVKELVQKSVSSLHSCPISYNGADFKIGAMTNKTSEHVDTSIISDAARSELNIPAKASGPQEVRAVLESIAKQVGSTKRTRYSLNLTIWKDGKEVCGSKSSLLKSN